MYKRQIGEFLIDVILEFKLLISVSDEITSQYKSSNLGVIVVSAVVNVCLIYSTVLLTSVGILGIALPLVAVCQVLSLSTEVSIAIVSPLSVSVQLILLVSTVPTVERSICDTRLPVKE